MLRNLLVLIVFLSLADISFSADMPLVTPLGEISLQKSSPVRIASDNRGRLYISDTINGEVRIYSNNGILLKTIKELRSPLGVGVDKNGYIYVGDGEDGSVMVFDGDGLLRYKLGTGDQEFLMPNDISITDSDRVYVVDSKANIVKVFNLQGEQVTSFGSGILRFPSGIYIDEFAQDVYVSDEGNKRIVVFDLNGVYKREIRGRSGMLGLKFLRPQGVAVDGSRLYIVDSYNSCVIIYDRQGSFLGYTGNYGMNINEYRIPLDITFDGDNKVFVTNYNNSRIEILGIDSFKKLDVNPYILNITAFEGGEPVSHEVNLSSIPQNIFWISSPYEEWISVSPESGYTPSTPFITVDPSNKKRGIYTVPVAFRTDSGVESLALLNINIKEPVFYVTPLSIELLYQKGRKDLPQAEINISSQGRPLQWNATTSKNWLIVKPPSGTTPFVAKVFFKPYVKGFAPGEYNASVVFEAGDVSGSPQVVNVKLKILRAGTIRVITNLEDASFEIRGPDKFSGSGIEWSTDLASPGRYTIEFHDVPGYLTPSPRSFTLNSGEEKTIKVNYIKKPVMSHIIAGSGKGVRPHISILSLDGLPLHEFYPDKSQELTGLGGADVDGDGIYEIVSTFDGLKGIYIFTKDGIKRGYYGLPEKAGNIKVRVYDINRDGNKEILVGYTINDYRRIQYLDLESNRFKPLFRESNKEPFDFAIGDFNDDTETEILIVDKNGIKIIPYIPGLIGIDYRIDGVIQRKITFQLVPLLATGDIDGDGRDEIILAKGVDGDLLVKVYRGDLTDTGISLSLRDEYDPQAKLSIATGDIDGDGLDEIITGSVNNGLSIIRIFESDGQLSNSISLTGYGRGINLGTGRF